MGFLLAIAAGSLVDDPEGLAQLRSSQRSPRRVVKSGVYHRAWRRECSSTAEARLKCFSQSEKGSLSSLVEAVHLTDNGHRRLQREKN